ncbi:MAG: proline--tRNA ligase [Phycisphaerales bacterium]|nr:proline--tRNA ligase [Phycisphaerales bacterium]
MSQQQKNQGKPKTAISPTREENYAEWYQQVVRAADMAETSPVRGCMVIKPWGWGMWENLQRGLDGMFKATGHKNAYFPLFIPLSFLEKEAEHVDGFAKECAVVTHHRLEAGPDGGLVPAGELDEPLVVRPTSETIIGATFAKWIQSHRDLPLLINQWANVVRWEMRTRLFLRTTEFLWQEGHTAHATSDEAKDETMQMLDVYADFAENWLAMPVIRGEKTAGERFPGAVETWCIEGMMQDRKALQAGTSHFLGQNFAKAQEIQFQDDEGNREFCWTTSWGVSTRLVGGTIMTHGDDDGMICPPMVAPSHIVVQPVLHKAESKADVLEFCDKVIAGLRNTVYGGRAIDVEFDTRDIRGGEKTWQWIKRGVPIRLEVGPRDVAEESVFMARRDKGPKEKESVKAEEFVANAPAILQEIQDGMLAKARTFREENTHVIDSRDEFYEFFKDGPGGFAVTHFSGSPELEETIKKDLAVTVRCVPLDGQGFADGEAGECPFTGDPSSRRVVWAKSY